MNRRQVINSLIAMGLYIAFLIVIFFLFDATLGKMESDFLSQHTKFIDYFRRNYWASGDLFPQLSMNYGLGQSFAIFFYHGLYNPFIMLSYVLPPVNPIYILELSYLIIIGLNTFAMSKLLDINKITGNLNSAIAILSSASGVFIFQMSTHPMFIYYLPIMVFSLICLHKMATANHKVGYIICVGLIFYTNFTFAPIISIIQFFYYLGLIAEQKQFSLNKLLTFAISYLIGVGLGMMVLLPQALMIISSNSRTRSISIDHQLFLPFSKVVESIATNPYISGLFVVGFTALLGTLIYLRKPRFYILVIPLIILLVIQPFNIALNMFSYVHLKVYIFYLPVLWLLFGLVYKRTSSVQFVSLMLFSLGLIIVGDETYQNPIVMVIAIGLVFVLYYTLRVKNKFCLLLLLTGLTATSYITHTKIVPRSALANYTIGDQVGAPTNSRELNSEKNNLDTIYSFTPNVYTSIENGYYVDAVRNQYESAKSSYERDTKYYTFDNIYYQNFFGIETPLIESNPIIYGVSDQDVYQTSEYQRLPKEQRILAVNDALFTDDGTQTDYQTDFTIETLYTESEPFTLDSDYTFDYKLPSQYQDGILVISFDAKLKADTTQEQRIYLDNQVNQVIYGDRYGVNDNSQVTFIINTSEHPTLNIKVRDVKGSPITYQNLKVSYQSTADFEQNKLQVQVPTNFEVDLNDSFSFNLNQPTDGYLATTLPYDDGYTITVDGKPVETELINQLYVGAKLPKGEHKIVISYQIPGFKFGQALSLVALIITLLIAVIDRKRGVSNEIS